MLSEEQIRNISNEINDNNLNNLLQWNKSGAVLKVEILASTDSCEDCKKNNGKIYSIEEAIKNRPLPCKDCSNEIYGYCRCTYLPVIE